MKKKIIIAALSCVLVCASCFGITYAYLIANDNVTNTFTVGATEIEVTENYEPPKKLEPGITFKKEPHVTNTGNLPCYVRMRADFSTSAAKEFCETLDINTAYWEYNINDGYYYYNKLLNPGEETPALFTKVSLKTEKSDGIPYAEADLVEFDILVYAEAIQHTDHDGECDGNEYLTVWG